MKRSDTYAGPRSLSEEYSSSSRGEPAVQTAARPDGEGKTDGRRPKRVSDDPQFSPDPAASTDRYRLVTPFSLRI